jgi:hypothetical protein
MKKQWYKINKDNLDVIMQERKRQEIIKFRKDIGKMFNIKPTKQ